MENGEEELCLEGTFFYLLEASSYIPQKASIYVSSA